MKHSNRTTHTFFKEQPNWCDRCRIRIAPYDRRIALKGKLYHPACYSRIVQSNAEELCKDDKNRRSE